MSILSNASFQAVQDDESLATAALQQSFANQKKAFAGNRNPTLGQRRERLEVLIEMMMSHRERIADALNSDFGAHPKHASDLIEVLGVVGRAQYVLEHLEAWMKPQACDTDPAMYGNGRAYVEHQPKGVIGNMVPWNFPFDLSVGPMIEMLAAGNRVIVKPSEYTPACSALLQEMVAGAFDPDLVDVAVGGVGLAQAFSAMPWDHLLYTGSPNIGRRVMAAAAPNLTPVTLELGGKCPAVMTPGSVNEKNVEAVVGTKMIKNGQMCVSVDYVLVPRGDLPMFVDQAQGFVLKSSDDYTTGENCTGMISDRHQARIQEMLDEARAKNSEMVTLGSDASVGDAARRMPISLVINPGEDLALMQEEIFGPILPVVPYDNLDDALSRINAGERPLALYVFGDNQDEIDRVVNETSSGGVAINTCAVQAALPSMGFGGSGNSGMGRHHGIQGFHEFSNPRGMFKRGDEDVIGAFYDHTLGSALVDAALSGDH